MIEYLLDTHALVWLLVADPRLPRSVRTLVEDATAQGRRVACSARIIAATALFLRVPLISRDRKIVVDGVPTLWG
ncbi:MAG: hypothetical protein K6U75_07555 [Firmicutes bacterium]|nr:hypothetical protein [Bacillota bacterium]